MSPSSPAKLCPRCKTIVRGKCPTCSTGWGNRTTNKRTLKTSHRRWRTIRAQILRDEPLCRTCGDLATELDHIVPVSQGGTDDPSNLQPLCTDCHRAKTHAEAMRGKP